MKTLRAIQMILVFTILSNVGVASTLDHDSNLHENFMTVSKSQSYRSNSTTNSLHDYMIKFRDRSGSSIEAGAIAMILALGIGTEKISNSLFSKSKLNDQLTCSNRINEFLYGSILTLGFPFIGIGTGMIEFWEHR